MQQVIELIEMLDLCVETFWKCNISDVWYTVLANTSEIARIRMEFRRNGRFSVEIPTEFEIIFGFFQNFLIFLDFKDFLSLRRKVLKK
jgi:hypothetical protein